MNLYALNETPINGWATLFGQATPTLALGAEGDGVVCVLGSANVQLELVGAGTGTREVLAQGNAQLELDATGVGDVTQSLGATVPLRLSVPLALGGKLVFAQATAAMQLGTAGKGHRGRGRFGESHPKLSLDFPRTDSRRYRLAYATADIGMTLTLTARDYRVAVLPSTLYPAPRARGATVECENRALRVPAPERSLELAEA